MYRYIPFKINTSPKNNNIFWFYVDTYTYLIGTGYYLFIEGETLSYICGMIKNSVRTR